MEEKILPALEAVPGLSALLLKMNLQGYDYRRDDEFMMWGSADLLWPVLPASPEIPLRSYDCSWVL